MLGKVGTSERSDASKTIMHRARGDQRVVGRPYPLCSFFLGMSPASLSGLANTEMRLKQRA